MRVILFDRFRCNAKRDSSMKSCYIRILYWCPVAQPEGMRCTLLSASVASIHSGERGFGGNSGRRCRRTGRQDEFLQRGLHWTPSWIPAGLRSPGYPPRSPPYKPLLLRGYFRFRGGLHAGWTPKKTALSLAKLRATPASIRFGPERNRKTMTWWPGPRLDPAPDPGKPAAAGRPAHASPEYIPFVALGRGSVNPHRCLSENSLTG